MRLIRLRSVFRLCSHEPQHITVDIAFSQQGDVFKIDTITHIAQHPKVLCFVLCTSLNSLVVIN